MTAAAGVGRLSWPVSARLRSASGLMAARAAWAAMAIAAIAVLPTLGRQPLSWNEAVTLTSARRSLPHLAGMLSYTDLPLGPYYLLMHAWVRLLAAADLPVTEWWLRLPSALAAVGAVGLLVVVVSYWYGEHVALLAGALLAVHPLLTFYAQDARPYALVTLALLGSTWALQRAIETPTPRRLLVYGVLVIATIYLHIFAIYAVAAQLVLIWRSHQPWRPWVIVGAGVVTAVVPLLLLGSQQTGQLGWIPKPSPSAILSVVLHLGGGAAFLVVLAVIAAVLMLRRRARLSPPTSYVLAWALLPPVALVLGDFVTPELVARYGLVAVPAIVTAAAVAAVRIGGRLGVALIAVALLIAAVTSAIQQVQPYKYENYRAAADTIGDLAQVGDAVVFLPISARVGFDVYSQFEPDLRHVSDSALAPGGAPAETDQVGGTDRPATQLTSLLQRSATIFVLGDPLSSALRSLRDATDLVEETALKDYSISQTRRWGDLVLTVLRRDSSGKARQ
jgi:mannosyltransferase